MAEAVRGMMGVAAKSKRNEHQRESAQDGSRDEAAPSRMPAAGVTGRIDWRQRIGFRFAPMHGCLTLVSGASPAEYNPGDGVPYRFA